MKIHFAVGMVICGVLASSRARAMKATIVDIVNSSPSDASGVTVVLDTQNVESPTTIPWRLQVPLAILNPTFPLITRNLYADGFFPVPPSKVPLDVHWETGPSGGVIPAGGTTTIGWSQTDLKVGDAFPPSSSPPTPSLKDMQRKLYGRLRMIYWTDADGEPLAGSSVDVARYVLGVGAYGFTTGAAPAPAGVAVAASGLDVTIPANNLGLVSLPQGSVVNPGQAAVLKYDIIGAGGTRIATALTETDAWDGTAPTTVTFSFAPADNQTVVVRTPQVKVVTTPIPGDQLLPSNPSLASMTDVPVIIVPPPTAVPATSPATMAGIAALLLAIGIFFIRRQARG